LLSAIEAGPIENGAASAGEIRQHAMLIEGLILKESRGNWN
jgi:hypothetical protein